MTGSILTASWPAWDEAYLVEATFECPVSFNGKMRFSFTLTKGLDAKEVEELVLALPDTQRYLAGKPVRKVVVVKDRIVNIVC